MNPAVERFDRIELMGSQICTEMVLPELVEQLDFHRLLNPIQVMLRSLKAVFAPMPHSVVKFIPEVNGNVKKKDDKTIME